MRIYSDYISRNSSISCLTRLSYGLLLISVFSFPSCILHEKEPVNTRSGGEGIDYATGFDIEITSGFRILTVHNPWQGARDVMFRYLLACRDAGPGGQLPEYARNIPVIRTPVRSVICLSTTHIALLDFIEETGSITAVSEGEYIYNEKVRARLDRGELPGIGYDMNLNYERLLELNPDVILAYGVDAEAGAWLGRLRDLGLNVVLIGEYLENSALAQAEWVKFMAHFFNKQDLASTKFSEIEKEYLELKDMVSAIETKPVVMSGLPWRNSWFVPGGNSLFASLIADAGGRYLWDSDRGRDNFPVDIEKIMEQGSLADFWVNTGTAISGGDILNADERLAGLRPFRTGRIYNNNARINKHGGNDYWESGIVNPHIILRDLIHILHPDLLPGHRPVYYREL
jgi:iron complex transport system substrate-binding protein